MRGKYPSNICLYEGHREEEVEVGALAQHPGVVTEGEVGGDHVEQSEHNNNSKPLSTLEHLLSGPHQSSLWNEANIQSLPFVKKDNKIASEVI